MTFSLSPEREVTDHTELELIFESYYADFEEIVAEIKTVKVDLNMKSCCYIPYIICNTYVLDIYIVY